MVDYSLEDFEKRQTQAAEDGDGGQLAGADSFRGEHGQIVEAIGTAIADGTHSTGDQLVPESLGEDFGVSRTVIREVLKELEARGMVQVRPGSGTRVQPKSEWDLLDPDVIRWRSSGAESARQVANLESLFNAVQELAVRQACQAPTPESLARLRAAVEGMRDAQAAGDWHRQMDEYVEFHRALLGASGSMILEQLVDPIEAAIRASAQAQPALEEAVAQETDFVRELINWHEEIVDAIEDRDEHTAELILKRTLSINMT